MLQQIIQEREKLREEFKEYIQTLTMQDIDEFGIEKLSADWWLSKIDQTSILLISEIIRQCEKTDLRLKSYLQSQLQIISKIK